jgi:CxxC motif-containing protein
MKKEFTCIVCPNSCRITVEFEGSKIKSIEGAGCPKGKEYVKNEITNPVRVFTGSVLVEKGNFSLVSVKTPSPIPKKYLKNIGEITHQIKVEAPIEIGQVVAKDLLDEDIDLVATRKVNRKNILLF